VSQSAWLRRVGMFTPVGVNSAETATSIRAGISRYGESSVLNRRFDPMTMALLPEEIIEPLVASLDSETLTSRQRRMIRLAAPALREATEEMSDGASTPLLLAGPEPYPDRPEPADETLLDYIATQSNVEFDRGNSRYFPFGRAGGMQALEAAFAHFAAGGQTALVGGVDSHLDLYLLSQLDADGRVLAAGVMDGFAPGEGAVFLSLSADSAAGALAELHAPALAEEPGHRHSDEPYLGSGLSEAVTGALAACAEPVQTVFASFNGESFFGKEWGVASTRNSAGLGDEIRIEHPADCVGDQGAAFGPLMIGLAALGMQNGYLPAPSLVWCSSEGASRGAVCVSAAGDPDQPS
jgi:3-oxoacyl-[acyl-carrier-protein] synthase I